MESELRKEWLGKPMKLSPGKLRNTKGKVIAASGYPESERDGDSSATG